MSKNKHKTKNNFKKENKGEDITSTEDKNLVEEKINRNSSTKKLNIFKIDIKGLVLIAPLTVIMIIFNELLSFNVYNLKINISFTLIIIIAGLYGPVYGGISMLVADLIGTIAFPVAGPFFPGFTISETLVGITYGAFLYTNDLKAPSIPRTVFGLLISMLIFEYLCNSIFLYMMYGVGGVSTLLIRASLIPFRLVLGFFTARIILPKIKQIYLK